MKLYHCPNFANLDKIKEVRGGAFQGGTGTEHNSGLNALSEHSQHEHMNLQCADERSPHGMAGVTHKRGS